MIIYLGTESKLKIQAVKNVIDQFKNKNLISSNIDIIGKDTKSCVPLTPFNKEGLVGAKNRTLSLYHQFKNKGDIFVGIESALVERYSHLFEECWCYIIDKENKEFIGYSSGFYLPEIISKYIKRGGKHIDIMKQLEKKYRISGKDTWGIYTKNIINRTISLEEAFRNAFASYLIRHKNQ